MVLMGPLIKDTVYKSLTWLVNIVGPKSCLSLIFIWVSILDAIETFRHIWRVKNKNNFSSHLVYQSQKLFKLWKILENKMLLVAFTSWTATKYQKRSKMFKYFMRRIRVLVTEAGVNISRISVFRFVGRIFHNKLWIVWQITKHFLHMILSH